MALYGLPDDYFSTFVAKVLSISEADVTRVARDHINPAGLVSVIVGDVDKVGPTLDELNLGEISAVAVA
jgi:predicted Zn-dependent peptidase